MLIGPLVRRLAAEAPGDGPLAGRTVAIKDNTMVLPQVAETT